MYSIMLTLFFVHRNPVENKTIFDAIFIPSINWMSLNTEDHRVDVKDDVDYILH